MAAVAPVVVADSELTIDELARRVELPVRTIREYQAMGLVPPPARRGRVGVYGRTHVLRLELIRRLQGRGYSLAGVRDLLAAWRDGGDLPEVLGLSPDQLVQLDEPGALVTIDQLERALPGLIPRRLDDLMAAGVVEACANDQYCVPSPSLLQLTADAIAAGYDPKLVVDMLHVIHDATESIADAVVNAMAHRPADADTEQLVALATSGRGLLAHGSGRLVIHLLGKRLGIADEADVTDGLRQLLEVEKR